VTDNGIGRTAAEKEKIKSIDSGHHSVATINIRDRIRDMNIIYGMKLQCATEDILDAAGKSGGTRVTLEIPLKIVAE
jgi:hypothetical protein